LQFDPNPDPCYTALRAGVSTEALGLIVAAMDVVKIYRTREVTTASYGVAGTSREFYQVLDTPFSADDGKSWAWLIPGSRATVAASTAALIKAAISGPHMVFRRLPCLCV
jgi:nucleoporin SEH1